MPAAGIGRMRVHAEAVVEHADGVERIAARPQRRDVARRLLAVAVDAQTARVAVEPGTQHGQSGGNRLGWIEPRFPHWTSEAVDHGVEIAIRLDRRRLFEDWCRRWRDDEQVARTRMPSRRSSCSRPPVGDVSAAAIAIGTRQRLAARDHRPHWTAAELGQWRIRRRGANSTTNALTRTRRRPRLRSRTIR